MTMQRCPGCKLELPYSDGPVHRYMDSSPGCWETYGKVLAREYSHPDYMSVHRLTVDAYAVQHPGSPSPQSTQSVGVHLMSLFAVLECGLSHKKATALIGRGAEQLDFTWLEPPENSGVLTVLSVVPATTAEEHCQLVNEWASDVWCVWSAHHVQIENWMRKLDVR